MIPEFKPRYWLYIYAATAMINLSVHSQYMIGNLRRMEAAKDRVREREAFAEKAYYDSLKILNWSNLVPGAYFAYPNEDPFIPEMSKKELEIRKKTKKLIERNNAIEKMKEKQRERNQKIKRLHKIA